MLTNNAHFHSKEINAIFGEDNILNIYGNSEFSGVSVDSRTIRKGNIFVALKGENIDGHTKILDAVENGASLCIASKKWFESHPELHSLPLILVNDTLKALGELAHYHRMKFDYPVIAIAGSNGKTTTKEITTHLLSKKFNVLKTYKNFNNQLGVPLMLLQMSNDYSVAVLEIATNEPGEIFILSEMTAPTHGLITNIGKEHLEGFIDLTGVEMEETYLFGYLRKHSGIPFINSDDEILSKYIRLLEKRMIFGQNIENGLSAEITFDEQIKPTILFGYENKAFSAKMKAPGISTALNAIAAVAIALYLEVTSRDIVNALESFEALEGDGYARMTIQDINGINILNDCYNANPSSMKIALDTLYAHSTRGKKYAVLGDMKELGEHSVEEHIDILKYASAKADHVLITGVDMHYAFESLALTNVLEFSSKEVLASFIKDNVSADDFVLLKGSRGVKMEEILSYLKK